MDESEALQFTLEAAKAAQLAAEKAAARGPDSLPLVEHLQGPITVLVVFFINYFNRKSLLAFWVVYNHAPHGGPLAMLVQAVVFCLG